MAFLQIATGISVITSGLKGSTGISLTNIATSAESLIATGSVCEIGGAFFLANSDITPNASSWTAIATGASCYLTITPSGTAGSQIITAAYTTAASIWSNARQGWYTSAASLTRYVGGLIKGGVSSYTYKYLFAQQQGSVTYVNSVEALSFNTTSTKDKKEDIKDFEGNALDIINNTKIVEYKYINDPDHINHIGLIIEDAPKEFSGNGKSMSTGDSLAICIKAIQELYKKIENK
jgi:hypothetical protein